jgi:hypothetical protein
MNFYESMHLAKEAKWLLVSLCKEDIRSYIDSYNRSHLITTSIMSKKYHISAVFATGHAGHNNR